MARWEGRRREPLSTGGKAGLAIGSVVILVVGVYAANHAPDDRPGCHRTLRTVSCTSPTPRVPEPWDSDFTGYPPDYTYDTPGDDGS